MTVYVLEHHQQVYEIWQRQGWRNLKVAHVDFHCDMRGLLIDRNRQCVWRIRDVRENLDCGNYLRHAVFDGTVSGIRWVHDTPGGRMFDVNSVKYTTDATAIPHRLLLRIRGQQPIPLSYEQVHLDDWAGVAENEFLDIDWDTFAEESMTRSEIASRVDRFFDRELSPHLVGAAVCYSPNHSLDTREEFEAFCSRLAEALETVTEVVPFEVVPKVRPLRSRVIPRPIYSLLQSQYYRIMLGLKRAGFE